MLSHLFRRHSLQAGRPLGIELFFFQFLYYVRTGTYRRLFLRGKIQRNDISFLFVFFISPLIPSYNSFWILHAQTGLCTSSSPSFKLIYEILCLPTVATPRKHAPDPARMPMLLHVLIRLKISFPRTTNPCEPNGKCRLIVGINEGSSLEISNKTPFSRVHDSGLVHPLKVLSPYRIYRALPHYKLTRCEHCRNGISSLGLH